MFRLAIFFCGEGEVDRHNHGGFLTWSGWKIGSVTPHPTVFADFQIAQDFALTGQSQIGVAFVRRETEAPFLDACHTRNVTFDLDGAGSTRSHATAVDRGRNSVVQRQIRFH